MGLLELGVTEVDPSFPLEVSENVNFGGSSDPRDGIPT